MSLTENGVRAVLSVEDGAQILKNSQVTVRSVSGIGEQYLNFEPTGDSGPGMALEYEGNHLRHRTLANTTMAVRTIPTGRGAYARNTAIRLSCMD